MSATTYKPTERDLRGDNHAFILGVALSVAGVIIAWQVNLGLGVGLAAVAYIVTGARMSWRVLVIRSHLGYLINKDVRGLGIWLFGWPMLWALVLYDNFPIMEGPEAALVRSKGLTGALEQWAAASRWKLGDAGGRLRGSKERYVLFKD